MPWDTQDYPNSWVNFDDVLRKKAIEMANAMLGEGYDQNQAIPIATSQAKRWYTRATKDELDTMRDKSDQDLRATDRNASTRAYLLDKAVHVLPDLNTWTVKTAGAEQAANCYKLKSDAIERGKEIAKNKETFLTIHRQDGTIQDVVSY
ncbi:Uncharacterized protein YdaT [Amphibacillus marinus]|uniref:Uncharacterized protein YdaT n=1 Tax=Amphibacillus marinus TaxID=872970 RepID=A0A1H8K4Q6_9BACI|nr:DUF2188 domain-containing protein [Amphibacillus marinus]SEN87980.1 Uncharacterized protein YdaT [Amphibacillus marinus]